MTKDSKLDPNRQWEADLENRQAAARTSKQNVLDRLKLDRAHLHVEGRHVPLDVECHCWLCDSIAEIERLRPMAESWESYEAAQERKAQMRPVETTADIDPWQVLRVIWDKPGDDFETDAEWMSWVRTQISRALSKRPAVEPRETSAHELQQRINFALRIAKQNSGCGTPALDEIMSILAPEQYGPAKRSAEEPAQTRHAITCPQHPYHELAGVRDCNCGAMEPSTPIWPDCAERRAESEGD